MRRVRTACLRLSMVTAPQRHSHSSSVTQTLPNIRDSISLTNMYDTYVHETYTAHIYVYETYVIAIHMHTSTGRDSLAGLLMN